MGIIAWIVLGLVRAESASTRTGSRWSTSVASTRTSRRYETERTNRDAFTAHGS
jgi:hypothetical protein